MTNKTESEIPRQRHIVWASPEVYAEFMALLDAPPQPSERLCQTMQTTPPWEKE